MSVEEIISSGLLESYVLGTASAKESAMISAMCRKHPELLAEIEKIEESLLNLAAEAAPPLSSGLKDKISAGLIFNNAPEDGAKVIALKGASETRLKLYRFGMAASLLLFVTSLSYNILMQQKIGSLNEQLAELSASKSYLAQEITIQQASLAGINQRLQVITSPGIKNVTLNGMNTLAGSRAMVYWNPQTSEVYFNASTLPGSPSARQYQLWAIVDGKPVDMGVIDTSGNAVFQKMKLASGAQAFAVTIEKEGGSATPSLETMCLLGNV